MTTRMLMKLGLVVIFNPTILCSTTSTKETQMWQYANKDIKTVEMLTPTCHTWLSVHWFYVIFSFFSRENNTFSVPAVAYVNPLYHFLVLARGYELQGLKECQGWAIRSWMCAKALGRRTTAVDRSSKDSLQSTSLSTKHHAFSCPDYVSVLMHLYPQQRTGLVL